MHSRAHRGNNRSRVWGMFGGRIGSWNDSWCWVLSYYGNGNETVKEMKTKLTLYVSICYFIRLQYYNHDCHTVVHYHIKFNYNVYE